eukprot:gnl/TRDRNA2_/TRDRNA2_156970_c0_seq2.p1 gnl/TRDRNA2_/TRDRNA2_156970_c0~~gnl/TRDRNA2_/TRDRNA2_156970_c0_seq2.p1  ORF type:complete len:650 (+),score=124.38 gnl/TRDRNA2_/TRDRNA2_156970_c0_seq2:86-2035(+)
MASPVRHCRHWALLSSVILGCLARLVCSNIGLAGERMMDNEAQSSRDLDQMVAQNSFETFTIPDDGYDASVGYEDDIAKEPMAIPYESFRKELAKVPWDLHVPKFRLMEDDFQETEFSHAAKVETVQVQANKLHHSGAAEIHDVQRKAKTEQERKLMAEAGGRKADLAKRYQEMADNAQPMEFFIVKEGEKGHGSLSIQKGDDVTVRIDAYILWSPKEKFMKPGVSPGLLYWSSRLLPSGTYTYTDFRHAKVPHLHWALRGARIGEVREVFVPPLYAYQWVGDKTYGIPENAYLGYSVEVVNIVPGPNWMTDLTMENYFAKVGGKIAFLNCYWRQMTAYGPNPWYYELAQTFDKHARVYVGSVDCRGPGASLCEYLERSKKLPTNPPTYSPIKYLPDGKRSAHTSDEMVQYGAKGAWTEWSDCGNEETPNRCDVREAKRIIKDLTKLCVPNDMKHCDNQEHEYVNHLLSLKPQDREDIMNNSKGLIQASKDNATDYIQRYGIRIRQLKRDYKKDMIALTTKHNDELYQFRTREKMAEDEEEEDMDINDMAKMMGFGGGQEEPRPSKKRRTQQDVIAEQKKVVEEKEKAHAEDMKRVKGKIKKVEDLQKEQEKGYDVRFVRMVHEYSYGLVQAKRIGRERKKRPPKKQEL